MKKVILGILIGSMVLFLNACSSTSVNEKTEPPLSDVSEETNEPFQKELKEILENTIPSLDDHFETNEAGLEAFVRQVEEYPPLVDLSMIDVVRERGKYYFSEDQMNRLNNALDETTAM